jgi:hypothetical protein
MSSSDSKTTSNLRVPTTHKRRSHYYRIIDKPVIEQGKWAVACFEVVAIGKVQSYCVIEYSYVDDYGYKELDYSFFPTKNEALEHALDLTSEATEPPGSES